WLIVNWSVIGGLGLALLAALMLTDFSVKVDDPRFLLWCGMIIFLGPSSSFLLLIGAPRWPNVSHAANVLSQMLVGGMVFSLLSYVAASAGYRLQDARLNQIDGWLGFDWKRLLVI